MENSNIEETIQEKILLLIIREICSTTDNPLSASIKSKVNKIISESDVISYLSLHKLNTADEGASNLLGIVNKQSTELSYSEQSDLNQAVTLAVQSKLSALTSELESICGNCLNKNGMLEQDEEREDKKRELLESIDGKLNILKEQEGEKIDLMMEWLNFKMNDAMNYNCNLTDLLTERTKMLDLKSKIVHLQILQSIFTETNNSVKAYSELKQDLLRSIEKTEQKIEEYKRIIYKD